jgi:hypothetical protein
MVDTSIWTPDTPGFYETLYFRQPPGDFQLGEGSNVRLFAVRHGSLLFEPIFDSELNDYLLGGEYDEVTAEDEEDECYGCFGDLDIFGDC